MLNFRGVRVHVTSNRYWTNHTPQKINGWNLKITKKLKFGKSSSNHPPPFFGGSSTPEFSRDPVVTSNHQTQQQLVFVTNLPGLGQGVQGWPVDSSLARRRPWRYSRTAPEKFNPLESAQKLVGLGWMMDVGFPRREANLNSIQGKKETIRFTIRSFVISWQGKGKNESRAVDQISTSLLDIWLPLLFRCSSLETKTSSGTSIVDSWNTTNKVIGCLSPYFRWLLFYFWGEVTNKIKALVATFGEWNLGSQHFRVQ